VAIVIGLVMAVVAVLLVLDPILRPASRAPQRPSVFDEPDDDPKEHRKELALAALKEIEFDRATGKLSDTDYQSMLTRYTKEAVEALRESEAEAGIAGGNGPAAAGVAGGNGQAAAGVAGSGGVEADDPIERLIAETRAANKGRRFCSNCGAALEGSGRFCVECGAKA
jgi:hypothetical protein